MPPHHLQLDLTLSWLPTALVIHKQIVPRNPRDVLLLSTIHLNEMVEIPKHRDEQESICNPKLNFDYNVHMNGVDKCDQYLSYYSLTRKSRKWWKKIFFRLVEISVLNAIVLYFKIHPELAEHCRAHKAFHQTLVYQVVQPLLDAYASPEVLSSPGPGRRHISNEIRLKGKHFLETSPNRRRCVVCAYKKSANGVNKGTKTKTYSSKCERHVQKLLFCCLSFKIPVLNNKLVHFWMKCVRNYHKW